MLGDPRSILVGVRLLGGGIWSAAKFLGGKIAEAGKWAYDKYEYLDKKLDAFKERHPIFKRVWNFCTHRITLSVIGLIGSVALAPLTGGFTIPFIIGLSASVVLTISSPAILGIQKYFLEKSRVRNKILHTILEQNPAVRIKTEYPEPAIKLAAKAIPIGIASEFSMVYAGAVWAITAVCGIQSALFYISTAVLNIRSIVTEAATRVSNEKERRKFKNENDHLSKQLIEKLGKDVFERQLKECSQPSPSFWRCMRAQFDPLMTQPARYPENARHVIQDTAHLALKPIASDETKEIVPDVTGKNLAAKVTSQASVNTGDSSPLTIRPFSANKRVLSDGRAPNQR